MAIVVGVRPSSISGDKTLEKQDELWTVKHTRTMEFEVIADRIDDDERTIVGSFGLPRIGSISGGYRVKKLSPTAGPMVIYGGRTTRKWKVSVEYDDNVETNDPTLLKPEVSWDSEEVSIRCDRDVEDPTKLVQNTAGEPLILTRPIAVAVLNISRYYPYSAWSPSVIFEYENTICNHAFWGAPAYYARMAKITAKIEDVKQPDGTDLRVVHVTFVIKFKFLPNTSTPWKDEILNYGNKEKVNGEIVRAVDKSSHAIQVKLAMDGTRLPEGCPGVYLSFNTLVSRSWVVLGINKADLGY